MSDASWLFCLLRHVFANGAVFHYFLVYLIPEFGRTLELLLPSYKYRVQTGVGRLISLDTLGT
jgi:hypothetical protein